MVTQAQSETDRSGTRPDRSVRFTPANRVGGRHRAHSRVVSLLRIMLPLLVLVIMGLIFLWPQIRETGFAPVTVSISSSGGDTTILTPRYVGVDDGGQPYEITADRAVRPAANPDQLDLVDPRAQMTLTSGQVVRIRSDDAVYDEIAEDLLMTGNVILNRDDGYEFLTDEAHANVGSQLVWGDRSVTGGGPAGTIDAEGFRIENSGNTIIFTGQSRLVLFQRRGEPNE